MKKLFVLTIAASMLLIPMAHAKFIYTETNATEVVKGKDGKGTLTDGVWVLGATRTAGTENLAVLGSVGQFLGTEPCPLDLTIIESEDGQTKYKAVSFDCLSTQNDYSKLKGAKDKITEFIAPDCQKVGVNQGQGVFYMCSNLTSIQLNANLTVQGKVAFASCNNLVEFFPRDIMNETFQASEFDYCSNLEGHFNFPNLKSIPGNMFVGCTKLQEVKAPNATLVDNGAFKSCTSLTNVVLPNVTNIKPSRAFDSCSSLSGEAIRNMLNKKITNIGQYSFIGCTSLSGELEWNFPDMTTKVVYANTFEACANLSCIKFKTPVDEILNCAFLNIAEGAEVYMHLDVPTSYGQSAIARANAPYPKIILKDNFDAWFEVMGVKNHVITREDFNNKDWTHSYTGNSQGWGTITTHMARDGAICKKEKVDGKDTVTVLDNRVIAFVMYNSNNGCWVMRAPQKGMKIIVR